MNKDLLGFLSKCRMAYYNGLPLIPDDVYDHLIENTELETAVGHETDSRFIHPYRMQSLQKVFAGEGNPPDYGNAATLVTPKLDGAAVSIQYVDGKFYRALTRGDGKAGLDISNKMRHIVATQLEMGISLFNGIRQITGEIVAPKEIANSRNYAAGALNLKNINEFSCRRIQFVLYGAEPNRKDYWTEEMDAYSHSGFVTVLESVDYTYPTDGIVYRLNEFAKHHMQGFTSQHPKGAFAFKSNKTESAISTLRKVVWQVGKSGRISPVAILDPVKIGDAEISRATLHNIKIIDELDLEIGCQVEVIRSGEIIPRIVRRVDEDTERQPTEYDEWQDYNGC